MKIQLTHTGVLNRINKDPFSILNSYIIKRIKDFTNDQCAEIALAAVENDAHVIESLHHTGLLDKINPTQLMQITSTAIGRSHHGLEILERCTKIINMLSSAQLTEIVLSTIKNEPYIGQLLVSLNSAQNLLNKINEQDFIKIALEALEKNENIYNTRLLEKLTEDGCLEAVGENPEAVKLFALNKFQNENYYNISMQAIIKNPCAARYLKTNKLTNNQYSFLEIGASMMAKQKFGFSLSEAISITNKSTKACKFLETENQPNDDLTPILENQIYEITNSEEMGSFIAEMD